MSVRRARLRCSALLVLTALGLALFTSPTGAHAQSRPIRRTIGIGSVLGFGVSYNVIPSLNPPAVAIGPQADLGTLELRFFQPGGHSIDLYSQLGNTVLSATYALWPRRPDEPGQLVFASLGALYAINVGTGLTRGVFALGLEVGGDYGVGGLYDRTHPLKAAFRIPARVGVERLFPDASLGVLFLLRPFFEVVGYAANDGRSITSQGVAVLAEVGFVFYPGMGRAFRAAVAPTR